MSFSVDTVFSELGHCRDLFPPGVESLSLSSTIPSFVSSFLLSVLVSIFFFSTVSRFLVFSLVFSSFPQKRFQILCNFPRLRQATIIAS